MLARLVSAEWLTVVNDVVVSGMADSCHDNTRQDNKCKLDYYSIDIYDNKYKCQAVYFIISVFSKEKVYIFITTSENNAIAVKIDKNDVN